MSVDYDILKLIADAIESSDETEGDELPMDAMYMANAQAVCKALKDAGLNLEEYEAVIPAPQPPVKIQKKPRVSDPRRFASTGVTRSRGIIVNEGDGMTVGDINAMYDADKYIGLGGTE